MHGDRLVAAARAGDAVRVVCPRVLLQPDRAVATARRAPRPAGGDPPRAHRRGGGVRRAHRRVPAAGPGGDRRLPGAAATTGGPDLHRRRVDRRRRRRRVRGLPAPHSGEPDGPATAMFIMLAITYVSALCAAVRPRVTLAVVLACGIISGLTSNAPAAIALTFLLTSVVGAYRVLLWMLGVVRELERARHVQAGSPSPRSGCASPGTCTTSWAVTCRSSPSRASWPRSSPAADDRRRSSEMLEVRRIAQDSLTELRAVVGGLPRRRPRRRAGRRPRPARRRRRRAAASSATAVPCHPRSRATLGWVVREGTTNVLRHSEATAAARRAASSPRR